VKRARIMWTVLIALFASTRCAWSDGGVPILVVKDAGRQWTLLLRPAQAAVGPIEFDLLGPDGSQASLELREQDGPWESLAFETGPDPRVSHARTTLSQAGPCQVRLRFGWMSQPAEVRIEVSDAPASLAPQIPWLFAWIPMLFLLWLRSRAIRARHYTAPQA
jgi:hypothetical protein